MYFRSLFLVHALYLENSSIYSIVFLCFRLLAQYILNNHIKILKLLSMGRVYQSFGKKDLHISWFGLYFPEPFLHIHSQSNFYTHQIGP